ERAALVRDFDDRVDGPDAAWPEQTPRRWRLPLPAAHPALTAIPSEASVPIISGSFSGTTPGHLTLRTPYGPPRCHRRLKWRLNVVSLHNRHLPTWWNVCSTRPPLESPTVPTGSSCQRHISPDRCDRATDISRS